MYTITLANGKKLENLELNGNNFISSAPVDSAFYSPEDFPGAWENAERTEES